MLTPLQIIITIFCIMIATILTRALPFILFPGNRETPAFVTYLGNVLPFSSIGMLIIYCLKDISIFSGSRGIPELISISFVVIVHKWKHNLLLSIVGGTVLYMVLV